jgi:hypothetical protein
VPAVGNFRVRKAEALFVETLAATAFGGDFEPDASSAIVPDDR